MLSDWDGGWGGGQRRGKTGQGSVIPSMLVHPFLPVFRILFISLEASWQGHKFLLHSERRREPSGGDLSPPPCPHRRNAASTTRLASTTSQRVHLPATGLAASLGKASVHRKAGTEHGNVVRVPGQSAGKEVEGE